MFTAVALDPGGTTGWAAFRAERIWNPLEERFEYFDESWTCGQLGPGDHHNELDILLGTLHTEAYHIICERFEYRNRSRPGLDLSSREYIGVAKRFCQERSVPYWPQSAAQGKGFVKDRHIKNLGLWFPGQKHAMDATRHLLFWFVHTYEDKRFGQHLLEKAWK